MPTPKPNEDKKGFISRCIPYVKKEHPDWKQDKCVAVCYSIWRRKHKSFDDDLLESLKERLEKLKSELENIKKCLK